MKGKVLAILVIMISITGISRSKTILPTSDFTANFCRFPFAWNHIKEKSLFNEKGLSIALIGEDISKLETKVKETKFYASGSNVSAFSFDAIINSYPDQKGIDIIVVAQEIKESDYKSFLNFIEQNNRISVILSAYYGSMDPERDYSNWRNFVKLASDAGCIITGSHGDMYQLGDISFWESVPVDIFAVLGRKIDGFQPMMPDFKLKTNLESSAFTVGAAVALIKASNPQLNNIELKQFLRERGRQVYWSLINIPEGKDGIKLMLPHFEKDYLGKYEDSMIEKIKREAFSASTLDMVSLLGITDKGYGSWCMDVLNVGELNRTATGKGVTVAILDHTFNKNHPSLEERITSPVSFIEGDPALSEVSDHGTYMAEDLVMVAPGVKIMPIVIAGGSFNGDPGLMIKAIKYAVENGADIISCSQPAIKGDQTALDSAIGYAISRGVSVVYINYKGGNKDVIVPGIVEFDAFNKNEERVNIVGTNFYSRETPITWGVSHSAPIISGVIAIIKEAKPGITPNEITQLLLKAANQRPYRMLVGQDL